MRLSTLCVIAALAKEGAHNIAYGGDNLVNYASAANVLPQLTISIQTPQYSHVRRRCTCGEQSHYNTLSKETRVYSVTDGIPM